MNASYPDGIMILLAAAAVCLFLLNLFDCTGLCLCACFPAHGAKNRKFHGSGTGILQKGRINFQAHSMLVIQICAALFFCTHLPTAQGAKNKMVPGSFLGILGAGAVPSGRQGAGLIYFDKHTILFGGKAGGGLFLPPRNITQDYSFKTLEMWNVLNLSKRSPPPPPFY